MTAFLPPRAPRDLTVTAMHVAAEQEPQAHLNQFFSPQVESDLAQSDHEAWSAVCAILITIVTLGLLLGIGGVLLTL